MDFERAKKARTAARSWVSRTSNSILTLLKEPDSKERQASLTVQVKDFTKYLDRLEEAQTSLEFEVKEEELEDILNDAEDYKQRVIYPVQVKLETISASQSACVSESSISSNVEAKLPKLELPSFKGDVRTWTSFWEQFDAAVNQKEIPEITKFSYLKSLLKEEAKSAISGLPLTAANYQAAVDLLQERFGRPEKIIFHHVQDLLALQVAATPTVKQLWVFYNDLKAHVRSLEALGIDATRYGVILTPLILHRLPADLRMEWAREGDKRESDVDYLMTFLKTEIERRERSQVYADGDSSTSPPTGAALHTSERGGRKPPMDVFCVCGKCAYLTRCQAWKKLTFEERKAKLTALHRCVKCLKKSTKAAPHTFKDCKGTCKSCKGAHSVALCPELIAKDKQPDPVLASTSVSHTDVLLQTVKVPVKGKKGKIDAVILFDTGSNRSYVSQDFVNKVGPEWVEARELSYASFGTSTASPSENVNIYNLCLQGRNEDIFVNATCINTICSPLSQPKVPSHLLSKIANDVISIPAGKKIKIDILIGLDSYWRLMSGKMLFLSPELVAQRSALGWVVSGCVPSPGVGVNTPSHQLFCQTSVSDCQVFWDLDLIGIKETEFDSERRDPTLERFEEQIERVGDRYSVGLPWKEHSKHRLVNNKANAMKRLCSLSARLDKDEQLKQSYNAYFHDMLNEGVIEEVPLGNECSDDNPVFYLPHHPVMKESSVSTKVRPVFDASAKGYNRVSLNDCMDAGPNYLPDLPALLIRFRRWQYALSADIKKAFLQVAVHQADRDVHRFLWDVNGQVRDMRFTRVPFGNKGSPFLLMATIKHHLSLMEPSPAVSELSDNLYMDDFLSGADTESDAKVLFSDAQRIMHAAGMTLTKWGSNSQSIHTILGSEPSCAEPIGVLGMKWTQSGDYFSFSGPEPPKDICVTKRVVLSMISRLFDPLGLLLPFTIKAKCLFQSIWRLQADWDEVLSDVLRDAFTKWLEELKILKAWQVPRRFFSFLWSEKPQLVIHGFGDASQQAYGACVYLLAVHSDGSCETSIVMSRARVAPLKTVSLPRLELLAALLCARLVTYVREALRLPTQQKVHCWTDSEITLAWVQKDPSAWKLFVSNRVAAIQQLTHPSCWHHCPGKQNPADLLTRGISAMELKNSRLWLQGPVELMTAPIDNLSVKETVEEARSTTTCTAISGQVRIPVMDVTRYSTLVKAIRVTAWVLRFVKILKGNQIKGELSFQEMTESKLLLLRETQECHYGAEIKALASDKVIGQSSPIAKLSPF